MPLIVAARTATSPDGAFVLSALPLGRYMLGAARTGFSPTEIRDVALNVDDRAAMRVVFEVAELGEEIVVVADARRVNTSPSVGTAVDHAFVENFPLNGRSLQDLLERTPGVVLTRGRSEFSVNGQRSNPNYITVDGVRADVGIGAIATGQSGSGQNPRLTARGGTNEVVAVEAQQEFRIETSSYAPEFGRTSGGQVSVFTRFGDQHRSWVDFGLFRPRSAGCYELVGRQSWAHQGEAQLWRRSRRGTIAQPNVLLRFV